MYRSIKCRIFGGKLVKKFITFCILLGILVVICSPNESDRSEASTESAKEIKSSQKFKIIEVIEDDIYLVKKPVNIFGNRAKVGEFGEAVILPQNLSSEIQNLVDEGFKNHAFNQYVSDIIALNRNIKDSRSDYCKHAMRSYKHLPKTSVIITFHNEAWSTLLRTIHSVLNRSPADLLEEIILVDDYSNMEHLKHPLDHYLKKLPKVKLIRCNERKGLIKARIIGTQAAKAPTLTFLDSHVECSTGWLEPLLDRIAQNPKNVAAPVIDIIDENTFRYDWLNSTHLPIGGFDWKLNFKWIMYGTERENPSLPIKTPTIAGGLFTIDREFFIKLGMYDPGFDIWGGENLELSFKTWMCGGRLEIIPCSHVGHIFREKSPYEWRPGVNVIQKNFLRLSLVWMDEYAKFYHMRIHATENDFEDVTDRKNFRKNLNCHDFEWYLRNVYPSQVDPSMATAQGRVRKKKTSQCIDVTSTSVKLKKCKKNSGSQFLLLTEDNQLRQDTFCVYYMKGKVSCGYCAAKLDKNVWSYSSLTEQIFHNSTNKCLSIGNENSLILEPCDLSNGNQLWSFEYIKNVHY